MKPALAFLVFLLLCASPLPAQTSFILPPAYHLKNDQGLPGGTVGFIHRDRNGYVWLSTMGGLCRYDGYEVKVYPEANNPRHLRMDGRNVQGPILEDKAGNIWFCTIEAIHRIDAQTDEISVFHLQDGKGRPLRSDYHLFHLESDRYLWIRQGDALYMLDVVSGRQHTLCSYFPYLWARVITGANKSPAYLVGFRPNNTEGIVLYEFQNRGLPTDSSRLGQAIYFKHSETGLTRGLTYSRPDSLWFCTDAGLLLLQPRNRSLRAFHCGPDAASLGFHAIASLPNGLFALGTKGHGLFFFDPVSQRTLGPFKQDHCDPASLSSDSFFSLYVDATGIFWLGHWKEGLDYINLNPPKFKLLTRAPSPDLEKNNDLRFLDEDRQGRLWMVNSAGQVTAYNPVLNRFLDLSAINRELSGGSQREIRYMSTGPAGDIWLVTLDRVYRISEAGQQIEQVYQCPRDVLVLAGAIAGGNHLYLSLSNRTLQHIDVRGTAAGYLAGQVRKQELREHNYLFTDGVSSDLFCGLGTNRLDQCTLDPNGELQLKRSLSDGMYVAAICYDPQRKRHWLATEKGLYSLDEHARRMRGPIIAKGMPPGMINTLVIDAKGRLWFASQYRVYCWTPGESQVYAFEGSDGLTTGGAFIGLSRRLSNGRILFGARDKLFVLDPKDLRSQMTAAIARVNALHVNDQAANYLYTAARDRSFRFAYKENTLSFEYAAIHFADPANNHVRYKLMGVDRDWIEPSRPGGVARYPELPPGTYTFHLQAGNSDQVWNPAIVSIPVTILPPFWATWWFRILMVCCLAALLILGVRQYFKNQLQRQEQELREQRLQFEKQRAVQEERNRIASEMHDDMGSGLAKMRFMSERIQPTDELEFIHQSVDKIALQANTLIENMGDIIWAMNSRFDTLPNLLSYTRRYAMEYLLEMEINCRCSSLEAVPLIQVGGRIRRNVFLVIKESLHNIVKHAQASQVEIEFSWDADLLSIRVADNGIGFTEVREEGNGLRNMEKRMEEIGGSLDIRSSAAGTTLLMQLPMHAMQVEDPVISG